MSNWPFDPAKATYVSLATYRRDGTEVRTPVWIVRAGERFYVFSERSAWKVKRLLANSHARLAECDSRGGVQSAWLDAQGRIVEQHDVIESAYVAFREKYGWQIRLLNFFSRLTGKYSKRAMIELQVSGDQETSKT